jgi:hypothetical protein
MMNLLRRTLFTDGMKLDSFICSKNEKRLSTMNQNTIRTTNGGRTNIAKNVLTPTIQLFFSKKE